MSKQNALVNDVLSHKHICKLVLSMIGHTNKIDSQKTRIKHLKLYIHKLNCHIDDLSSDLEIYTH